jgi:hypothetical protein
MIIPSIYLPIEIKLFNDHFQRFFEDYIRIRPEHLKHTLNQKSKRAVYVMKLNL